MKILHIHSRKMNVSGEVVFEELARSCKDFNGAQLKAVCVEAGGEDIVREHVREGLAGAFVFGFPEIGLDGTQSWPTSHCSDSE